MNFTPRRIAKLSLLPVLALGAVLGLHAQMHHHHLNPDQATARMTRKLGLTPDQAAQVKPILLDREQKMEALKSNTALPKDQRKAQRHAIQAETRSRLDAVLTDQQRQQMARMHHGHHHDKDQKDSSQAPKAS